MVNVFIPLVNVKPELGPTEFVPGSHINWATKRKSITFNTKQGHCYVFDYRIKHRGTATTSKDSRPVLYLVNIILL